MKKCPKCGYIVVKDDYCKICSTCVIYEEHIITEENRIGFNKYMFFYYLKKLLVPVISFIVIVIFTILIGDIINQLVIIAIILSMYSVLLGIFEDYIIDWNWNVKRFTKEYSRFRTRMSSFASGIISILIIIAAYYTK